MEILFESDYYRVVKILSSTPSDVTVICYAHFLNENHTTLPSAFGGYFAKDEVLGLGFNYIAVQVRSNDFFQRDGIIEGLEQIAKVKSEGEKYISYGGSKGGYGAINFYNIVNSDIFLALAPLASSNKEFMESIGDTRTKGVVDFFRYDFILEDKCREAHGIVVYDPTYDFDAEHVRLIKEKTMSEIVFTHGAWHFPGKLINQTYGLKNVLREMVDCIGSKERLAKLANDINEAVANKLKIESKE